MEKLNRYNIMRFVYGIYHGRRIRYKDHLLAAERKLSRHAVPIFALHRKARKLKDWRVSDGIN